VWFVRNIKVLERQTTVTTPIECKSFFATLANRAARFAASRYREADPRIVMP
jgi:hypothetical protein